MFPIFLNDVNVQANVLQVYSENDTFTV